MSSMQDTSYPACHITHLEEDIRYNLGTIKATLDGVKAQLDVYVVGNKELEKRIVALEQYKLYVVGIAAIIGVITSLGVDKLKDIISFLH